MPAPRDFKHDVIQFLAREISANPDRLGLDVAGNLGIDGDDGLELMRKFAVMFDVDLSEFDPADHFGPEGGFNPLMLLWPAWRRARRRMRPLTVADFVRAAEARRWMRTT
jgi:hypothetical protein